MMSSGDRTFVGFGFGPIQSGLFLLEAYRSGNFSRLVVSEIDEALVRAVRAAGGDYWVNIAHPDGIETVRIHGVEVLNPQVDADRVQLLRAIGEADEMATALPSVRLFKDQAPSSVARLLVDGCQAARGGGAAVIYAAENHNYSAELLQSAVEEAAEGGLHLGAFTSSGRRLQFLNTVIGKMSGVITDPAVIEQLGLHPLAVGLQRAVLVEEFNHILISRIRHPGFERGIGVFEEKADLLPFEEAKLFGHNAIHALLGYLANLHGLETMAQLRAFPELMSTGRLAFAQESGASLIRKYDSIREPLFTPAGFAAYADDLLERMTNPHLHDLVERVIRDPGRKLGWNDRLIGTMRLALDQGVDPARLAIGAAAALAELMLRPTGTEPPLRELFKESTSPAFDQGRAMLVLDACWGDAAPEDAQRRPVLEWIARGWSQLPG
ncbi:MAG: hypothetical protein ACOX52_20490 [Verrucomicrobiota bacterium]|jgi:mannitol-1-phosphate/altronate dehydrogenase